MVNWVWAFLLLTGVVLAAARGEPGLVAEAVAAGAGRAVQLAVPLSAAIMLWTGLMQVADEAGLTRWLSRVLLRPARRLFPGIPADDPAMGAILMALSANVLGLGNAATPLGLRAMRELQRLNPDPTRASPAMCTLLALSTSSLTMVPTGVIALRAAAGARQPADVLIPTLLATACSTAVALLADAYLRRRYGTRGR